MSHVAVIVGISGRERYLARAGTSRNGEVPDRKHARRFRCAASAETAAQTHIATFKPLVQRLVSYRVEPADAELLDDSGQRRHLPTSEVTSAERRA